MDFFLQGVANAAPLWYSPQAFRQEVPRGLLLEGSAASGASYRKALFLTGMRAVVSVLAVPHADFWKGPPRLEAFLRNALAG